MARTGRLGSVTFGKESTWGTKATINKYLRVYSESLKREIAHAEDDSLIGELYTTDMIKISDGIGGSMEGAMHGDDIGYLVHGVLGSQSSLSNPVKAWVLVGYDGTSTYERLTKSGATLTAEKSTNGSSWTADTAFSSTAGAITLSSSGIDTLSELATYVSARTGFSAIVFGDSCDSTTLADFTATSFRTADVKVGGVLMKVQPSSSSAKMHKIVPAGATTNLPSFSFLINRVLGTNASIAAVGGKIKSLALKSTAKDLCKFSIELDCKQELESQNDSTLTPSTIEAYLSANMQIVMEDADGELTLMDEIKDYSITLNANLDDNRNIGSFYKMEQERQKSTIEISFTGNNSSGQYAPRADYVADSPVSFYLYWKGNDYADSTALVPFNMLFRIPSAKLTDYNSPLSTQDRLVISATAKVVKNTDTTYSDRIIAYVIDNNTASY